MTALTTLFPVLFMITLGYISRVKKFVSTEQKDGANHIIFNVLFPVLIFHILFTATLKASYALIVVYVFAAFCVAFVLGHLLSSFTGKKFAHVSPYMLTTNEGGNVALPLYLSIVGASSTTIIFDLAGVAFAFIMIPILVANSTAHKTSLVDLVKTIFSNTFVIATLLGLSLNLVGGYAWLSSSLFNDLYVNTLSMATAPIVGLILFVIGYNLEIHLDTLGAVLKLLSLRIVIYTLVILGFFLLFPGLMADKLFMMAVLIYFMSPTGFAMPILISPLIKSKDEVSYMSAIISLNMIITLIVYAFVVIFIA